MLSNTERREGTDANQTELDKIPPPTQNFRYNRCTYCQEKRRAATATLLLRQELNSLPNVELCLEQQNPKQHLLSGYPSTAEHSPPYDRPKATEQMQEQSCTDHDAAASSTNLHLPLQPTPRGKGREQKCPEVLHGVPLHQQPASSSSQKTRAQDSGHHPASRFMALLLCHL